MNRKDTATEDKNLEVGRGEREKVLCHTLLEPSKWSTITNDSSNA